MPIVDLDKVPKEIWLIFTGIILFGLILPMLASHGVLKIFSTLKTKLAFVNKLEDLGFYKKLILGWLVVLPVYVFGFYSVNGV